MSFRIQNSLKRWLSLAFMLLAGICQGQNKYQQDFDYYWQIINDNFAYFERQKTDWIKVKSFYQPRLDSVKTTGEFVRLLEAMNHELHNGHVFLNTNTAKSNRPIPTGADLKVEKSGDRFVVTEVRKGFSADSCGIRKGMVITRLNGLPIESEVRKLLPKSVSAPHDDMYQYAATTLLAGTHDRRRIITALVDGEERIFYPDTLANRTETGYSAPLEMRRLAGNLGYIRINNSLGDQALIEAFDKALDSLMGTAGLILDLSETPSGGNTTVARALMGRFVRRELPYQKHIYTAEEKETGIRRSTLELVSPRRKVYTKPLVVIVGYWTGSMGEGMAIGFDGMKRARIIGTKMAGLLGEIFTYTTPVFRIPFSVPAVQLQHVSGQPREDFVPLAVTGDPVVAAARMLKGR